MSTLPSLDLNRVLANPRFRTTFDVQRYAKANDAHGRPVQSLQLAQAGVTGVVCPDKARTLQRTMAGDKQVDSITVVTTYRLSVGAKGPPVTDPDVVTWNGAHYLVIAARDWSQYGRGFIEATADMLDFVHP